MKKYMLLLLIAVSVQNIYAQYGYWYKSEFVELKPIPNLPYYYVNSIPSKTKLDIRQIYNSLSAKNDVKLVSRRKYLSEQATWRI